MSPDRNIPPGDADPLDELLRQAEWPEPTPLQLAGLESAWKRARPRRRWPKLATAAAAAVIVTLITWNTIFKQADPSGDVPVAKVDKDQMPSTAIEQPAVAADDNVSRPPTPLELAFLQAAEQQARRERHIRETDPLEIILTKLTQDPQTPMDDLAQTSDDDASLATRILEELPRSRGQRRMLLAQLLVSIEPPDAMPVFLELWSDPALREFVEPTVVRMADVPTLAALIHTRQPFNDRVRLLLEIGSRPDVESQGLLIDAAIDPQTRPAALAAARWSIPPAEFLFRALTHQHPDVRIAAALLLGEHADADITRQLIGLARQNPGRSEPWIALLQRDDAEARMIVAAARHDPLTMAFVNMADVMRTETLYPVKVGSPLL